MLSYVQYFADPVAELGTIFNTQVQSTNPAQVGSNLFCTQDVLDANNLSSGVFYPEFDSTVLFKVGKAVKIVRTLVFDAMCNANALIDANGNRYFAVSCGIGTSAVAFVVKWPADWHGITNPTIEIWYMPDGNLDQISTSYVLTTGQVVNGKQLVSNKLEIGFSVAKTSAGDYECMPFVSLNGVVFSFPVGKTLCHVLADDFTLPTLTTSLIYEAVETYTMFYWVGAWD